MKNKIDDLRNHLFATLEALQDKDAPMDLDRAKAIADVATVVVNSAKVEVAFLKATNASPEHLPFFTKQPPTPKLPGAAQPGIITHKAP